MHEPRPDADSAPATGGLARVRRGPLDEALHLGEAALEAAHAGRWEEVRALQEPRDAAIRSALSSANPDFPDRVDMDAVLRLVALDRELVAAAEAECTASGQRIARARRAAKASKAYAD